LKFTQLVVAGGATLGLTDVDGVFIDPADTVTEPRGFGIRLDGMVVYSPMPLATLTLKGQVMISFTDERFRLDFNASLSANIAQFIQASNVVSAAGSLVVQYAGGFKVWGAARLVFDAGAIPFLDQAGITAEAQIYLRLNSDAAESHAVTLSLPVVGQQNSSRSSRSTWSRRRSGCTWSANCGSTRARCRSPCRASSRSTSRSTAGPGSSTCSSSRSCGSAWPARACSR
jgi:hypothetical protein